MTARRQHPLWHVWQSMIKRCEKPTANGFKNYGGRGIAVCDRWRASFNDFVSDMGPRPSDDHSLDRVDSNGNYEPGNCRWATRSEQARNTRLTRYAFLDGVRMPVKSACEITGIKYYTAMNRIRMGMDPSRAVIERPMTRVETGWAGERRRCK